MLEITPEEVAKRLFGLLLTITERHNIKIGAAANPDRPKLSATVQTDDPKMLDAVQIAISYPASSTDAIQSHHVARIAIYLDGKGIDLTLGRSMTAKRLPLTDCPNVYREVREAIQAY